MGGSESCCAAGLGAEGVGSTQAALADRGMDTAAVGQVG